jgi:hypothetical protein
MRRLAFRMAASIMAVVLISSVADAADDLSATSGIHVVSNRMAGLASERRASSDLRLRILYSRERGVERRPGEDFVRPTEEELIPVAELVEQARGATDPMLLDLLIHRCATLKPVQNGCDRVALARRWTDVDTENQLSWLTLAAILDNLGNHDEARATVVRAARASRWHEYHDDVAQLLAAGLPKTLSPQDRILGQWDALLHAGEASPIDATMIVNIVCRTPKDLHEACAKITSTMMRDGNSILTLQIGTYLAARIGQDPTITAAYRQRTDAIRWSLSHVFGKTRRSDDIALDDAAANALSEKLRLWIALGEIGRAEQWLQQQHVDESEAAQRYVASLTPEQLKLRDGASR